MNILWYIVLGLAIYIVFVNLVDFLVAKYKKPKNDYFPKGMEGDNAHDGKEKTV
jgi:hypothetical protein